LQISYFQRLQPILKHIFIKKNTSGMKDGAILQWNPLDHYVMKKKITVGGHVTALSFSENGEFLASADHNQSVIIWTLDVIRA
jgi:hypothetical protein